jgi:hypothetical protein
MQYKKYVDNYVLEVHAKFSSAPLEITQVLHELQHMPCHYTLIIVQDTVNTSIRYTYAASYGACTYKISLVSNNICES